MIKAKPWQVVTFLHKALDLPLPYPKTPTQTAGDQPTLLQENAPVQLWPQGQCLPVQVPAWRSPHHQLQQGWTGAIEANEAWAL